MEIEKFKKVWQSPANYPGKNEMEQVRTEFGRRLQRRHRVFAVYMVWVFGALAGCTGLFLYNLLLKENVSLAGDWGVIPLLGVCWVFGFKFLEQFRKHQREHSAQGNSIVSTLRASLAENGLARSRIRLLGLIYGLGIPALGLAMHQLRLSGKLNANEAGSMLLLFGVSLAVSAGWAVFYYCRKLVPEKQRIEALLHDYELKEPEV